MHQSLRVERERLHFAIEPVVDPKCSQENLLAIICKCPTASIGLTAIRDAVKAVSQDLDVKKVRGIQTFRMLYDMISHNHGTYLVVCKATNGGTLTGISVQDQTVHVRSESVQSVTLTTWRSDRKSASISLVVQLVKST